MKNKIELPDFILNEIMMLSSCELKMYAKAFLAEVRSRQARVAKEFVADVKSRQARVK